MFDLQRQWTKLWFLIVCCFALHQISISDSSYNGQTCGNGDQPIDNSTYCPSSSEIVTGCQAAVNYALRLVCRQCPAGITWQQWSGEWRNIPGNNQTLQYPAKQVDPSLAGCYRCSCNHSEGGVYTVTISVDVKPPVPPTLMLNFTQHQGNLFHLPPKRIDLAGNTKMVCISFTSMGYPDVIYGMYYKPIHEKTYISITNHSCLQHSDVYNDSVCYTPPEANQILYFMSVVHNIAGNITVEQTVYYIADPLWSIKPHPAQTSGSVIMDQEGGVGTAVCAAYKEDRDAYMGYFVCPIPDGMTVEEAACLYNRQNLRCYHCAGIGNGFNLTSTSVSVLGIETSGCLVNMWVVGQYVCLAQRQWGNGTMSMFQPIGSFNSSKPVAQPTSQPAVCTSDTSLLASLIAVIAILLGTLAGVIAIIICWHCCKSFCKSKCSRETELGDLSASDASDCETSRLLERRQGWPSHPTLKSNPATSSTVKILCRALAPCDSEFTCCAPPLPDIPFHPELGKEYQIQYCRDGQVLHEFIFVTPDDRRKEMKPFPPDLEKAVPLTMQKLLRYCDKLAPHYQAVGHLLGLSDFVNCLKTGNETPQTKMMQILQEWIGTGHATWATLVLGLECDISSLRGLASEIRKDLWEKKEKQDEGSRSQTQCGQRMSS